MILSVSISLIPVFAFLAGLMVMDSYKLIRPHRVAIAIAYGAAAAILCAGLYPYLLAQLAHSPEQYSKYAAPFIEEAVKSGFILLLIARNKVGFPVDAAIAGFSVGAGFAAIENIWYLNALGDVGLHIWFIRGFGTAIMHCSTTALLALITLQLRDRQGYPLIVAGFVSFAAAYLMHAVFNHFPLDPLQMTLIQLIVLPPIVIWVFQKSENATQDWLGVGFDTDQELLKRIAMQGVSDSRVGDYLDSMRDRFPGPVVADMLCYLKLHVEISIAAKGKLLMRKAGFDAPPDPALKSKFNELEYLKGSIGRTGLLAMSPFIHTSSRDLWQIHFVTN